MGRVLGRGGGPECGVGYCLVMVGWVREAVCGRAWLGAQGGGKPQCWGTHGPLPTVQLLLILNSWHTMGIQALVVLR